MWARTESAVVAAFVRCQHRGHADSDRRTLPQYTLLRRRAVLRVVSAACRTARCVLLALRAGPLIAWLVRVLEVLVDVVIV